MKSEEGRKKGKEVNEGGKEERRKGIEGAMESMNREGERKERERKEVKVRKVT